VAEALRHTHFQHLEYGQGTLVTCRRNAGLQRDRLQRVTEQKRSEGTCEVEMKSVLSLSIVEVADVES
jgi:hypothetical protein